VARTTLKNIPSLTEIAAVENTGGIPRDLWENELELSVDEALRCIEDPQQMRAWIASRTGRQLDVLCRILELDGATRIKDKRASLARYNGQLIPFYLTDRFSRRKGTFAIADLAASVLPDDVIDLCRGKHEDTFDTKALLYAMLHASPENLKKLFHLDKIHKSGFARMSLKQKGRQPDITFEEFLQPKKAQQVLEAFERQKRDQRQSQLKKRLCQYLCKLSEGIVALPCLRRLAVGLTGCLGQRHGLTQPLLVFLNRLAALVRSRTDANTDSIGLVVRKCCQCASGNR